MIDFNTECIVCQSSKLLDRGRIYHPTPTRVAGVDIDLTGIDFHLLRCVNCDFQFKWPSIPESKLLACYAAADHDHWGMSVDPINRNFDVMAGAIRSHASGQRILDIGCFNGAFLDYLGSEWERFGVEPCKGAIDVASQRGVTILGELLDDVPSHMKFDVITAFDVLEHIVSPNEFFGTLRQHLSPNGIFVSTSGDTDALSWRMQKARYWYCSYLPEHVSFYCRRTLDYLAEKNDMKSISHNHMSHKRTSLSTRTKSNLNGIAYSILMRTGWLGLPKFKSKFATRAGTAWASATDHFVHVMKCV